MASKTPRPEYVDVYATFFWLSYVCTWLHSILLFKQISTKIFTTLLTPLKGLYQYPQSFSSTKLYSDRNWSTCITWLHAKYLGCRRRRPGHVIHVGQSRSVYIGIFWSETSWMCILQVSAAYVCFIIYFYILLLCFRNWSGLLEIMKRVIEVAEACLT